MHACHDRLWHLMHVLHQLAAHQKQLMCIVYMSVFHLAKVVTSGEHRAVGCEDDACCISATGIGKGVGQCSENIKRECIALCGVRQRDRDRVAVAF